MTCTSAWAASPLRRNWPSSSTGPRTRSRSCCAPAGQPISLDSTIGEDGETSIGDLIEDVDAPEASELVDRQLMAEQLRSALDALTPREATIMAMRFGLYDGNPHTLDEIGRALGLTRERIRQLEKQSLSKLRHPSRAQPLLDFAS